MAFRSMRQSLNIIADHLLENSLVASTLGVTDVVVTNITATASQHLTILGVTGKDIIMKLTDAAGARKVLIKDSADDTVASIDSDGIGTFTKVVAPIPTASGDIEGAPTNAECVAAFGAAAIGKQGIYVDTHESGKTYLCIASATAYSVLEATAAA